MYIYAYVSMYVHTYIHICYINVCMYVYTCVYTVGVYVYICVHLHVCVCIHVCVYVYVYAMFVSVVMYFLNGILLDHDWRIFGEIKGQHLSLLGIFMLLDISVAFVSLLMD